MLPQDAYRLICFLIVVLRALEHSGVCVRVFGSVRARREIKIIIKFVKCLISNVFLHLSILIADKQQEFDLPSLRIDENDISSALAAQKQRSRSPRFGGPPMSQISGVSRPLLSHTNSFTGERLPTFGVETPHENVLGTLLGDIDTWGIDIFKISDLSLHRPLTCIAYTVFQVKSQIALLPRSNTF